MADGANAEADAVAEAIEAAPPAQARRARQPASRRGPGPLRRRGGDRARPVPERRAGQADLHAAAAVRARHRRRADLVQNAETLAHVALIARFGPAWFREIGTPREPGSALVTLSGAVDAPGRLRGRPRLAAARPARSKRAARARRSRPILVGGYFGTWVGRGGRGGTAPERGRPQRSAALGARASSPSRRAHAASPRPRGSPATSPTRAPASAVRASTGSARSPTRSSGSPRGDRTDRRDRIERWVAAVRGRGACRHPDGASRFAASALEVFADEVELHLRPAAVAAGADR